MASEAVAVSFRFGDDDGVSVEARKWAWALNQLGFRVRRVAGQIVGPAEPEDVEIPALAIDAPAGEEPDPASISEALEGADLVIVDNVCSLPLNVHAARAVAGAVARHRGRILFRHHDLPWQRRRLAQFEHEFPPRTPGALHATVNLRSRRELQARSYDGVFTIHNYVDFDAPLGDRRTTRETFGFDADSFVLFQPARAIERKNVPGGLRFGQRLRKLLADVDLRYWLSGPAEDGYAPVLERVIAAARVPVTLGRAPTAADAYAACDAICFPSTWEGFGNPIIESIWARRACAAFPYPVLSEILAAGVGVFSVDEPERFARFLRESADVREQYYDVNERRARLSFSLTELPGALERAFAEHGWVGW
jgi:glycosyltransferase involved in cell wall biosynthesis